MLLFIVIMHVDLTSGHKNKLSISSPIQQLSLSEINGYLQFTHLLYSTAVASVRLMTDITLDPVLL